MSGQSMTNTCISSLWRNFESMESLQIKRWVQTFVKHMMHFLTWQTQLGLLVPANTETPTQTPAFTDGVQKLETWAQSSIHARTVNPIQIRVDPNRCNIHNLHWEFISWATLLSQSDTVSETHMLAGYAEMTKIKTNPPKCEDKIWHVRPGSQICLRGYLYGLSWHSLIWVMTDFIQKLFWMM